MKINLTIAAMLLCSAPMAIHADDAKTLWTNRCMKCHGPEGKGDTKMGRKLNIKDMTDAKVQAGFSDEQALKALKEGIKDEAGSTRMKAVEGLSDAELNDLVAYVRGLKK